MPPQPDADAATNPAAMEHLTAEERDYLFILQRDMPFKEWASRTNAIALIHTIAALRVRVAGLEEASMEGFQRQATQWAYECFPPECVADRIERGLRFLEEAMELAQSVGVPHEKVRQIVDYVFRRPIESMPGKEVGGAMVTLAVLCHSAGVGLSEWSKWGLAYCVENTEKIRRKHEEKRMNGVVSSDAALAAQPPSGGKGDQPTGGPHAR